MKKDETSQVPQRATLEINLRFSNDGVAFEPNIPRSEMTADEMRDFEEQTLLLRDGLPTDLCMRILSNWPVRFVGGLIAEVQGIWEGGAEKAEFNPESQQWTLMLNDNSLCNQAIVGALTVNDKFWSQYWLSSHRNGKCVFDLSLPPLKRVVPSEETAQI